MSPAQPISGGDSTIASANKQVAAVVEGQSRLHCHTVTKINGPLNVSYANNVITNISSFTVNETVLFGLQAYYSWTVSRFN